MAKIRNRSNEADGASAVAHELDTGNSLATAGAKLLSIKNLGVEKAAFDKDGNFLSAGANSTWVVRPDEGGAAIKAAIEAAGTAGGGIVQLLEGTYTISAVIDPNPSLLNNVIIRGVGAGTILNHNGSGSFSVFSLSGLSISSLVAASSVAEAATSVTTTVAANAAPFVVGAVIRLEGIGVDTLEEVEMNEVAIAGDGGTGVIGLKYPIRRAMTSVNVSGYVNGKNIRLEDMRVTSSSPFDGNAAAVQCTRLTQSEVRNIIVDSFDMNGGGNSVISFQSGWKNKVNNCFVRDLVSPGGGIGFSSEVESMMENNTVIAAGGTCLRAVARSSDCSFINNTLMNSDAGIIVDGLSGTRTRRIRCSNNKLSNLVTRGIYLTQSSHSVVSDNLIDRAPTSTTGGDTYAIEVSASSFPGAISCTVTGNSIKRCRQGIGVINAEDCTVSGNSIEDIFGSALYALGITVAGTRCSITGNVVRRCNRAAVEIGNGDHHIVANNVVDTTITSGVGINLYSGAGHVVMGNIVRNTVGAGLELATITTDSIVMGNNCLGEGITTGAGAGNDFIGNKE